MVPVSAIANDRFVPEFTQGDWLQPHFRAVEFAIRPLLGGLLRNTSLVQLREGVTTD